MTRLALVLALALVSCTYHGGFRFGAQPSPAGPDPMAQRATAARAERVHRVAAAIAQTYDAAFAAADEADQLVGSKHYEDATQRYRKAEQTSTHLLAWFGDERNRLGRGPTLRYLTEHDGTLDEATLVANLLAVHDRAQQAIGTTWDKAVAQLAQQLGARAPAQRAVLFRLGRPEVQKSKRQTCWTYRSPAADETFCWSKGGKLAKHDKTTKAPPAPVVVARAPRRGAGRSAVAAQPTGGGSQPAEEPGPAASEDPSPSPSPSSSEGSAPPPAPPSASDGVRVTNDMNQTRGYVNGDGTIRNEMNQPIGYVKDDGTITNEMNQPFAYVKDDGTVTNEMNQPVGYVHDDGSYGNAMQQPIGSVRIDGCPCSLRQVAAAVIFFGGGRAAWKLQ